MTSCKQVHQVDTGHLQERRTQGGAPAFAGTLYTRASGACEIQEGYPLPQGLDSVCKLPALADFGDYEIHKPTCCLIRCHWLAGRPSSRATGRVHISKGKILILGVLCKAHCQTICTNCNQQACTASQRWIAMQEHGIGQEFAMYYIAYAAFSELRGNFTRAESIYQQGLEM